MQAFWWRSSAAGEPALAQYPESRCAWSCRSRPEARPISWRAPRPEARRAARQAGGGRQPRRRRRHDRRGSGGERRAGRLHAARSRTIGTHAINPSLYTKLRYDPVKDFAPVSADARRAARAGRAPVGAGEEREGADRAREGQARQAHFASAGNGSVEPPLGRALQVDGRRGHDPRSLQGQRRRRWQTCSAGASTMVFDTIAVSSTTSRPARCARSASRSPQRSPRCRTCPTIAEVGPAGLRRVELARRARAGDDAEGHRRAAQRRDRGGDGRPRDAEAARRSRASSRCLQHARGVRAKSIRSDIAKWGKVVKASGARID